MLMVPLTDVSAFNFHTRVTSGQCLIVKSSRIAMQNPSPARSAPLAALGQQTRSDRSGATGEEERAARDFSERAGSAGWHRGRGLQERRAKAEGPGQGLLRWARGYGRSLARSPRCRPSSSVVAGLRGVPGSRSPGMPTGARSARGARAHKPAPMMRNG